MTNSFLIPKGYLVSHFRICNSCHISFPPSLLRSCYELNVCVPTNSYVEALTCSVMVFGRGPWELIRFKCSGEGGVLMLGFQPLCEETPESLLWLSSPCEDTARRRPSVRQKETPPETDHTGTLILDFKTPEL